MTLIADILKQHLAYNAWATVRLLDAASALNDEERTRDFGTADKSVLGTLVHTYRSDRIWLGRLQFGTPPVAWALPDDEQWIVLSEEWRKLLSDWRDWSLTLDDTSVERVVEYQDRKGNTWADPLSAIVLHVVNHGTHHRGQVSGFLRGLGKTPPFLDLIAFARGLS